MRRFLFGALVSVTAMFGLSSAQIPAQAKAPGPNGRIAFAQRVDDGGPTFVLANADGSDKHTVPVPVGAQPDTFAIPVWSPDRTELLISNVNPYDDFYTAAIVDPDGSNFRLLANSDWPVDIGYCSVWVDQGSRLLCLYDPDLPIPPGVVSIRASDGGDPERLTTNPYGGTDTPTDVSPDGSQFVFLRSKNIDTKKQEAALFVANIDGTGVRQLTPFRLAEQHGEFANAQWSPDGREIISQTRFGRLFVVRPDGTGLRIIRLQEGTASYFAFEPDWSPDGTRIVFCMFVNGHENLFTANPDGSNVVQMTHTPVKFENGPDWGTDPLA